MSESYVVLFYFAHGPPNYELVRYKNYSFS